MPPALQIGGAEGVVEGLMSVVWDRWGLFVEVGKVGVVMDFDWSRWTVHLHRGPCCVFHVELGPVTVGVRR